MSTPLPKRRPQVQRFGLAGIGAAVLFVGIASPAAAATDVVLPLEPAEVALLNIPVENYSSTAMDPMNGPTGVPTPVVVQYGETLTVDLADGLDPSNAVVEIEFPDTAADTDSDPDKVYSTDPSATDPLLVTPVPGTNDLTIALPADDTVNGPLATLRIVPVDTDPAVLGPEFTVDPEIVYQLDLSATAPTNTTLYPELLAFAQVPCALSSPTPCPVAVTAGSGLVLDLTADSALRDLGLTDLTGIELELASIDDPTAAPVPLTVEASGSTARAVLPAELAAGSYALVLGQPTASGFSIVLAELAVAAAPAPVAAPSAAPTTAAPSTQAVVANTGLRSNTGVTAPAAETGTGTVAAGAGLLLLAGAGGVAVARTRRRPAVETGTGEA
ncbi:hypothetical protein JOD57_003826 [Geodermatophilus bullaregiensis]|uniref:hypothetical protein n=1 Tax=Geodermatophilus bullaregiensis TaxID=1564160 RepID=UPI00195C7E1E|nr:hypothetical protein [Geodermatophilus bullaregiensis]MBM7807989.1 hypothetical protein [Geodermatophilus bullaregiensis]